MAKVADLKAKFILAVNNMTVARFSCFLQGSLYLVLCFWTM